MPDSPRGAILDPRDAAAAFRLERYPAAPALRPFVRHYWFIRWRLERPHAQQTIGVPAVNAVLERDTDSVSGFQRRRFERVLAGEGAVFGVLFHPGGFAPFYGRSAHPLTDRLVRFTEAFREPADALREAAFRPGATDADAVAAWDAFLLAHAPQPDPAGAEVDAWVALAAADPTLGRAEAWAERIGAPLRTLQRRTRYYIGVSPKQILRRFRLQEAAARLADGGALDQAAVAFALGYADQAHFVRDFTAVIGRSPGRYAAAQRD